MSLALRKHIGMLYFSIVPFSKRKNEGMPFLIQEQVEKVSKEGPMHPMGAVFVGEEGACGGDTGRSFQCLSCGFRCYH